MLKFLRLYQGWILAVFGTFLVITFLLPQAIQGLFQSYAVTGGDWATVGSNDSTISNGEFMEIQGELRILEMVGNPIISGLGADKDPAYWYLLTREADQAGLIGGAGQGQDMLTNMSQQLITSGRQVSETSLLRQMMGTAGFTDRQVFRTLAKVQGVSELARQFQTAARYSDERLRQAAAEMTLAASADIVVIDATKDPEDATPEAPETTETETTETEVATTEETEGAETEDETSLLAVETPTEETIVAQFEAHRSSKAGEGTSGFGYMLPDRAAFEWIRVDKDDVKAAVDANAQLDPIDLRKRFINDPTEFGALGSSDGPAKFSDYESVVRDRVLRDLLDTRMAEIEKFLADQTQLPRRGLNRTGTAYDLPDDWSERRADFSELASALAEEFKLDTPPAVSDSDGVVGADEINQLDGIGTARSTKFGRQPTQVSTYIMALREFGNESSIPAQEGLASPVFKDPTGNLYIFRVTETDPAREADSVDEVRDQVLTDATNLSRFNMIEGRASELESNAIDYGLQPIADQYDSQIRFTPNLTEADARLLAFGIKNPTRIPGLRNSENVVDTIVERASGLDYTVPTADIPVDERTLVIPDEDNLAVAVVQITSVKPLTNESWRELAASSGIIRVLASEETAIDFTETFSLDALMARHNFKSLRPSDDDDTLIEEAEEEGLDATGEDEEATG